MTAETIARVTNRMGNLERMSPAQLQAQWTRTFKTVSPDWPPDLLRHAIGYQWQERVLGSLSHEVMITINRLVAEIELEGSRGPDRPPIGTRYVRSWGGEAHHVTVSELGYEYRGEVHASLTEVAQRITGRHRSGPLFFGLRARR